jgi:hypothetical protein
VRIHRANRLFSGGKAKFLSTYRDIPNNAVGEGLSILEASQGIF